MLFGMYSDCSCWNIRLYLCVSNCLIISVYVGLLFVFVMWMWNSWLFGCVSELLWLLFWLCRNVL